MGLTQDISIIKQQYRELFGIAHQRMQDVFSQVHAKYSCSACRTTPEQVTEVLHAGCGFRAWQSEVVWTLENVVAKQIVESLDRIKAARETQGGCHMCGACCSLASSQFSPAELRAKAQAGDVFAEQFTRVFLPYASPEAARQRFPDTVTEILEQTQGDVHFYHCPYLSQDNKCTIYKDPRRPDICSTYPETPLILMYKGCGYQPWKEAQLPTTLLAHATLELCQHYAFKALDAVKATGAPLPAA